MTHAAGPAPRRRVATTPAPGAPAFRGAPIAPFEPPPAGRRSGAVTLIVTIAIMCVALVVVAVVLVIAVLANGVTAVAVATVAAVVPLTVVWLVVLFIDRWEPEPVLLQFGALLWGGGIAVGVVLLMSVLRERILPDLPAWWGPIVDAPVFEEFWKGTGVLVLCLIARRHVNGPTDGVVLGALIGAGFAFSENILYFSQGLYEQGVGGLAVQFAFRGVALPLLHPLCVSLTGFAIGWAAQRGGFGRIVVAFFVGLVPAIIVHALWNAGSTLIVQLAPGAGDYLVSILVFFFAFMVPVFIGWIVLLVVQTRRDRRVLRARLAEYAAAGWFSPSEVDMLTSMSARANARRWARSRGAAVGRAMRRFMVDASRLAHIRETRVRRPEHRATREDEEELLHDLHRSRAVLVGAR